MSLFYKYSIFVLTFLNVNLIFGQSGNLDSTYHYDGYAMPAYWQTNGDTRGQKVAIQSDGKAVVVGYHKNANYDFALIRYNTDGSMDSTFGGDGLVTSSLYGSDDYAYAVAIQPDGKIVAAGYCYHTSYNQKVFRWQGIIPMEPLMPHLEVEVNNLLILVQEIKMPMVLLSKPMVKL
jgi:uncharacterized delta-60 repeat protein